MTLDELLNKIGKNTVDDAKLNLKSKGKKASGNLYNSLKYKIEKTTLIFSMADYWEYVNNGRKKGSYVPIKPLKKWCKLKGLKTNLAYAISKNIKKNGIKPTKFFTGAFDKNTKDIDKEVENYIEYEIEKIINL